MIKHSHLSFSTAAPCACKLGWHPPSIHRVLSMHLKFYFECKFTTHLCNQSAHLPKKIKIPLFFLRISTIYQRIAFFVGFGGGIL